MITVLSACSQQSSKGGKVSPDEFEKLISSTEGAQIVDVRTAEEYASGHVANAVNMDINAADFEQKITGLDKSKPVFVYCLSGGRSAGAVSVLEKNGFNTIYEMPGIMAWNNANKPLVTDNAVPSQDGPIVKGLTEAEYLKTVASYGDKYVLVDFNAVWCGPCKKLSPILDKVAEDKKDKLVLLKLDADENPDLLQSKGIEGIPYLELYKDGKLVWSNKGLISESDLLSQTKL
ncbi:MAG: thioredoxin domain-containing protein [Bacteroidia bacterium]|nr:thioredoxin domain-containing protein [Bacteroidia bacterium]